MKSRPVDILGVWKLREVRCAAAWTPPGPGRDGVRSAEDENAIIIPVKWCGWSHSVPRRGERTVHGGSAHDLRPVAQGELLMSFEVEPLRAWFVGAHLPPGHERGFHRVVAIVSASTFIVVLLLASASMYPELPGMKVASPREALMYLFFVAMPFAFALVGAAAPWAIFYLLRWVIRGFSG